MELKSIQVSVKASRADIISFLSNSENLWLILPQDKISDFKASMESCSFKVQGGIENGSLTDGYIHFDGEVNAFLKMMVEKPLSALFNYMSEKLKSHFEQ